MELAAGAALIEPTDYVILQLVLALGRADVARCAERPDEEREALEQALSVAEAKGYRVMAARIGEQLDQD
jgi:hypothetical protein